MRRVVVTGLGLVTPLADGVEKSWERILDAQSGAGPITHFDPEGFGTTYACEVPYGDGTDGTFNPDAYMPAKDRRKVDTFILFALAAAEQAVQDAGWTPENDEDLERTGVLTGSGIGGLNSIAETAVMMKEKGPRRVSPFFVPGALINLISGQIAIKYGFKGPNHAVVTACSTGAHAIGDATQLIKSGRADVPNGRTIQRLPVVPMMRIAMVLLWAKVRAWLFLKTMTTLWPEGPRFMPKCWGMG